VTLHRAAARFASASQPATAAIIAPDEQELQGYLEAYAMLWTKLTYAVMQLQLGVDIVW
jgi:hypothetical protein